MNSSDDGGEGAKKAKNHLMSYMDDPKVDTYFALSWNRTRADKIDMASTAQIRFPDDAKYVPTLMSCSSEAL